MLQGTSRKEDEARYPLLIALGLVQSRAVYKRCTFHPWDLRTNLNEFLGISGKNGS